MIFIRTIYIPFTCGQADLKATQQLAVHNAVEDLRNALVNFEMRRNPGTSCAWVHILP